MDHEPTNDHSGNGEQHGGGGTGAQRARLVVVGGGNMGAALLAGLIGREWSPAARLAVVEVDAARRAELVERFPGVSVVATVDEAPAEGALLAVKPHDVPAAMAALATGGVGRVVSVAAGVTTATMEAAAGRPLPVVRAMPNTPALVGQGAAAIAPGAHAGADDLDWAAGILEAVGTVVRVPESQLDAVTGLSGSGPAYLFLVAEALIEGGVLVGLSRATSRALVGQLLVGSAALLASTGDTPESLRASVTSPGGTTAAGLHALESHGVRAAFLDAVKAATLRAQELGAH
jgi:pyrroline-5-carboxylate reductase